jgi:hypothetical protein
LRDREAFVNFLSTLLEWALLPFFLLGRFVGYCRRSFRRRWLFSLLLVLVTVGTHLYIRLHQRGGGYAAIAYSPSTGVYGSAAECYTLAEAEQRAMKGYRSEDARIVVWAENSWCALALSEDKAYGLGHAHTRAAAERLALEHCREHSQKSCYIAVAVGVGNDDSAWPPDALYAAIAYSRSTGRSGSADKCPTLAEAERLAVQRGDAPDAQVLVWANHEWCALAVGEDRAFGFAWGDSRADVERRAMAHCRQYTDKTCRIAAVVYGGAPDAKVRSSEPEHSTAK